MNRGKDAIDILTSLINESEESKKDANLYVLRANVYIKENQVKLGEKKGKYWWEFSSHFIFR